MGRTRSTSVGMIGTEVAIGYSWQNSYMNSTEYHSVATQTTDEV